MSWTTRVLALALALAAWVVAGCNSAALAGGDDVELAYDVNAFPPRAAAFGEDLRALVLRRLAAARIGADVTHDERGLRVVVSEAHAPRVDELLTWTGTLLVLELEPGFALEAARAPRHLIARRDGEELFYEGSRGELLEAIEAWPIDRDHRVVAEPMYGSTDPRAEARWRTRVANAVPIGEIGDGALVGWGDGPSLRVRGASGSPADEVIRGVVDRAARVVIARGRISLGPPRFEEPGALLLAFGTDKGAYARARSERQLLTTPRLPPLRRATSTALPPNRGLAIACLVVPVLLSLAWLVFVRRFDRAHPEPRWLVAVTFLLGAAAVVPAGLLEAGLSRASSWLDPSLATFGGQAFALPLAFVVFTIAVGLPEEGAKRLAAELAVRRREFDEPMDRIVYGLVASLGFAAAENIRYFTIDRLSAPIIVARCFMSVPAHMFFGALWGYALGARLVRPRTRTSWWLLAAAACHGLFDALLSIDGAGALAVMLNVGLASAFVALVRRALRHGVVTEGTLAIPREERALFRVGRPALFWTSATLLHVLAFGLFLLGAYDQLARHRLTLGFVAGSSLMLALLAVAAFGVTATMPLDVAVDAHGVTFGGAARSWRKVRGFTVHADHVELDCEAGPLRLGPASPRVLDALAAALVARLGDGRPR